MRSEFFWLGKKMLPPAIIVATAGRLTSKDSEADVDRTQFARWSFPAAAKTSLFLLMEYKFKGLRTMAMAAHLIAFGAKKTNAPKIYRGCRRRDWQLYTTKPNQSNRFAAQPVFELYLLSARPLKHLQSITLNLKLKWSNRQIKHQWSSINYTKLKLERILLHYSSFSFF